MGAADEGFAPARLLRQRTARCHVRGHPRSMRRVFRDNWRTGVRVGGRWRQLGADRSRPSGRAFGRSSDAAMIRVVLPSHLRTLAGVRGEIKLEVRDKPPTQRAILDALETGYPMLRGTIRDHVTQQRRAFIRFFACEQDLSHESPD